MAAALHLMMILMTMTLHLMMRLTKMTEDSQTFCSVVSTAGQNDAGKGFRDNSDEKCDDGLIPSEKNLTYVIFLRLLS